MSPQRKEAVPQQRDGPLETKNQHQDDSTDSAWDLDYELDQVANIASPLEEEQDLRRLKDKSGLPLEVLRRELKHRRGRSGNEGSSPVSLVPEEPEPESEPVGGIELAESLATEIRRYLVLPFDAELVIATWALFSHTFEVFRHAPYLAVISPIKGCGKSTVLDVLENLVPRRIKAEGFSAASIYRVIDKERPTLLIDELDAFLKGNDKLRGILNSGYQKGGLYVCVQGEDHEPKAFGTWAPKAVAKIGELPATLDDRSIVIRMERKVPTEAVASLGPTSDAAFLGLKRRCIRWAIDHRDSLAERNPDMGDFHNRQADRWRPLFAIAEEIGGPWPDMLRGAASELENRGERSYALDLLEDTREIFDAKGDICLRSDDIVQALIAAPDRPWAEWSKGRPITPHALAKMLRGFGIKAERGRVGTKNPVSVYARASFEPVWERYFPSPARGDKGASDTSGTDREPF